MKTILYNPIFINPQAYYVFPRLTRYLQPDNESTAEPANYIGTIEVKVIAYGDTTLKRTYTNTDSIDLSEFKNTWIRISLFTKVGSCVLGEWKIGNMESDLPYIDPEVLASLKAVVIVGNKTNNDSDRAIVKNLVDADNPFVISNAAFKLNSGFGKYEQDFTDWKKSLKVTSFDSESIKFTSDVTWVLLYHPSSIGEDIPSFKVRIKLYGEGTLYYNYITQEGKYTSVAVKSEIFETPICYNTKYIGEKGVNVGFTLGVTSGECSGTITQIPSFEGAFVTDGIDDLITSTKTVQEMLGGSNEITVVSMIHQVKDSSNNVSFTNYIRGSANGYFRNIVNNYDKTGIYGYTSSDLMGLSVVNNILGDKNDYTSNGDNRDSIINGNFSVQGYSYNDGNNTGDFSSVAWYWTIIANKVLTTDQINQVIAYFNLDRTLKPDILCNTIKQGITNENHAEFGDKLIDFSGNGRDIQLNNIAWKGDSGIGKYETELSNTSIWTQSKETTSSPFSSSYNGLSGWIVFANTALTNSADMPSFKIQVKGLLEGQELIYRYYDSNGQSNVYSITKDGEYTLPSDVRTAKPQTSNTSGFQVVKDETNIITITQIPSHAGGLCLDGINDFGKVTGMPIYKDYTVVADYIRTSAKENAQDSPILSKSQVVNNGAFVFNYLNTNSVLNSYSFGINNRLESISDSERKIYYQSKYVNDGKSINSGTGIDYNSMWLGTYRDNVQIFFNGAIYSLMSFPYSMSEFLIERQLKKYKLGTLYPNMVEFRPIIKANDNYKIFYTAMLPLTGDIWERINIGDYVPVGRRIAIQMSFDNEAKKLVSAVSSQLGNITIVKNSNNIGYTIFGDVLKDKSPQKISITIEQDENYVLFNPVINSNYKYISLDFFLNNYQKKINIGDYIPKDAYLRANLYLNNNVDEPAEFTFNGVSIGYSRSITVDTAFNIGHIYNYDSPQEVNITIDEYIRYEDIVQPYPVLLRFNDESGKEVSWGGKFRVGSTITRIGSAADSNLLPNIYNIFGLLLNDNQVTSSKVIVEKTMVFKAKSAYIFDNNEPKVILSPSRLRIPNSSYKILGYIPDISGHGNHGVIHNSAYTGMSGANGYTEDFTKWTLYTGVKCTDSIISLDSSFNKQDQWILFKPKGSNINQFTINIKGIPDGGNLYLRLSTDSNIKLENGINEISSYTNVTNSTGFFIGANGLNLDWSNLVIEQVGEYEGAYCLDGVDDFVTIPTVTGGKQVLMKVNWQSIAGTAILYDQRTNGGFAIFNRDYDTNENKVPAYRARNIGGNTYIDGILNEYIYASQLQNITHNIVELYDPELNIGTLNPKIGSSYLNSNYAQMSLYDFMLFDNISTDDKIKQLNEYVGIEGNTEWRKTK